ncbi:hypothetical protein G7046_g7683 [Stylonectria norvegica]|nr:hypothetical protein G7046_g7683 [Stylonectria norvegica]
MLGLEKSQRTPSSGRREGCVQPQRTETLQGLYDRWRDSEQDSEHGWSRYSSPQSVDEYTLQIPVSDLTDLYRSSSQGSGHAYSSALSGNNDGRRARRHGPLPRTKRERTAFIRRLGACATCRVRKVRCDHWDLVEFEASYQQSKRNAVQAALNTDVQIVHDTKSSLSCNVDLLGMAPTEVPTRLSLDMAADLEALWSPSPPRATFSTSPLVSQKLQHWVGLSDDASVDKESPGMKLMGLELPMVIGNETVSSKTGAKWECRFNNNGIVRDEAPSSSCTERFSTPDELTQHFGRVHHPIRLHDPPIFFRCRQCTRWNGEARNCLNCGVLRNGSHQQWIYGYAVSPAALLCVRADGYQRSEDEVRFLVK